VPYQWFQSNDGWMRKIYLTAKIRGTLNWKEKHQKQHFASTDECCYEYILIQTLAKPIEGSQSWNKKKHKIFLTSEFNLHTTVQWYQEQRNQVFQLPEGNQKMGFLIAQQGKNKTTTKHWAQGLQKAFRLVLGNPYSFSPRLWPCLKYKVIL